LQTGPLLYEAYIATGKVKHIFLQFPLESIHPQARSAAEASLCAAKQGAEAFWSMHELLFEKAGEWGGQENPTELFKGYAAELGLDTDVFVTCLESGETSAQVQAQIERGIAAGVGGTPAFFVNDWFISGAQPFEVFQQTIEKAQQGEHPPPTPTPLPPGVTPFDPNPERPGYTYGGDAYCGSEDAEITLAIFIDFQSAENRDHFLKEWPELEKNYVDTGKVRLMVKYFPALEHTQGFTAAEAAECAGQQGAFCAMYDLLFSKQEEWSQAEDVSVVLKKYAADLGLDAAAFATCLDGGKTSDKVMEDFTIGQQNQFPPAPLFWVFKGEQGSYVPVEQLQEAIEQFLAQ
jgi:protein-disulfide isomerase